MTFVGAGCSLGDSTGVGVDACCVLEISMSEGFYFLFFVFESDNLTRKCVMRKDPVTVNRPVHTATDTGSIF